MWILWVLRMGPLRYNDIRRQIPCITEKILTQQLRKFEKYGIIKRVVYPQVPPKVEYSLTELGETLKPVLDFAYDWGKTHASVFSEYIK